MYKIFWWVTAILLITYWLTLADRHTQANNDYWSKQVEQCSKVGGFMNYKGQCEIN